ncbi:hypothetical protein U2G91_15740 [Rhodococcoides fascians]|uniref:hypothetical protein n=1 Tax=Rhodococcoides fascians TaxID=1828 RepID=UPI002ACD7C19|nr:hypothetical protein [Rhodococcus fascians]WQH26555.1 hypothetical protein U2G91_15740 [Rhodococcus fascians]
MSNPETTETASDLLVSASAHVVGVLAEALAQHRGGTNHSGDWECSCGKEGPEKSHDAHVASVVAALPNIRIVDLVAERAEAASRDARRHLSEMRCINGVAGYYCNVTYAERGQYYCEYAAKGLTHYFDTPEHIAELEARAVGGQ